MSGPVDYDRQHKQLSSVSSQSSNDSATLAYMASDPDSDHDRDPPNGARPPSPRTDSHSSDRTHVPTRASTLGSPHDLDQQRKPRADDHPHARSEDLNHTTTWSRSDLHPSDHALSQSPAPPFLAGSRPGTPGSSSHHNPPSPSDHSGPSRSRPRSVHSDSSLYSDSSTPGGSQPGGTSTTHTSSTSVAST
ncbi:hypothetical protein ACG7TL_005718 [Trametes sanguinea]